MSDTPFRVCASIPVRTYDVDFGGVVSNIVYLRWAEDLRLRILDNHLPLEKLVSQGLAPVVAETRIRYRRPVRLFDPLMGEAWLTSVTPSRLHFRVEFRVNGDLVAEADQTGCIVDMATGRPTRVPPELRP